MGQREEEPIVWANEARREVVRREHGKKIVERFPQSAKGGRRWERVVDGAGNIMMAPTTNCGSLFDLDDPAARDIKRKQRALGVFALRSCPIALVMAGEISRHAIDTSLHDEHPCPPGTYSERAPCPHALREAALRRTAHLDEMNERIAKMKTDKDLLEEMAKSAQTQTKDLVEGLSEAIASAVSRLAVPVAPPVAPPASSAEKKK